MNLRKVISRRIQRRGQGVDLVGDVNAVISANVGERRSRSFTRTSSSQRIVQHTSRESTEDTQKPHP